MEVVQSSRQKSAPSVSKKVALLKQQGLSVSSIPSPIILRIDSKMPGKQSANSPSDRFRPTLHFWQSKESSQSSNASTSSAATSPPTSTSASSRSNKIDEIISRKATEPASVVQSTSMGLDEEMDEKDRKNLDARDAAEASAIDTASSPIQKESQDAISPSTLSRQIPSWNSQVEWAKHESFVHPIDVLPTDNLVDEKAGNEGNDELQDQIGVSATASSSESSSRRTRQKGVETKRRQGVKKQEPDKDASFTWATSSEEEEDDDDDTSPSSRSQGHDLDSSDIRNRLNRLSLTQSIGSRVGSTPSLESDTFFDAETSSTWTSPPPPVSEPTFIRQGDRLVTTEADTESSFLPFSPKPHHTPTPSSATLRQDANFERQHDLHHQTSTSTLLGIAIDSSPSSSGSTSVARKRMSVPITITSHSPPPTPPPKDDLPGKTAGLLGPSGTIRGRPRGATVGAMPDGSKYGRFTTRARPRSMLCDEFTAENAYSVKPVPPLPSPKVERSQERQSSGQQSSDGVSSDLGYFLNHTPSSSGYSSPGGLERSSTSKSSEAGSRSRSGSTASLLQQVQFPPKSHASFVIAVVGHRGVGKSTLIRKGLRQFGLSKPNTISDKITSHSTVCIVDSEQRTIEVLEIDASILLNGPTRRFAWPRFLPRIDGVILCYDAMQMSSFRGMAELLENFSSNSLCTLMMACKSEGDKKAVDPVYASDMAAAYHIGLAECEAYTEGGKKNMRDCFSFVVKDVAKSRANAGTSSRRLSNAGNSNDMARTSSKQRAFDLLEEDAAEGDDAKRSLSGADSSPSSFNSDAWRSNISEVPSSRKMSESVMSSADERERRAIGDQNAAVQEIIEKTQHGLQVANSAGGYVSITELWDKLFYAAVSGNDERFLLMMMVFYRGFSQPIDLLRQLIARFDSLSLGEQRDTVMIRYSLMRLTTMLADWMQEYPGDLSSPETYTLLVSFINRLQLHPATMHVITPMLPLLDVVKNAPDMDAHWSKNQVGDVQQQQPSTQKKNIARSPIAESSDGSPSRHPSGSPSPFPPTPELNEGNRSRSGSATSSVPEAFISVPRMLQPIAGRQRSASDVTDSSDGQHSGHSKSDSEHSITRSNTTSSAAPMSPPSVGSASITSPVTSQTSGVSALDQRTILKNISNSILDTKEDLIADELTRIEWVLFSEVGSRDLLRHILVSRSHRSQTSPVAKSIAHFNYISFWVCSMILIQSKTKVRARMLEKFMEVAGILRKINNYNTLHAVLAGLGQTSIHRLKLTRELLNGKPVIKTYQSLARLMGSDRSFAAYRMALENSQGRTIPYLGVHLQDILSMSDGNPSRRESDGMIHWRKFSLMDEIVMTIVRCQQYQEPVVENPLVSKLILNLPLLDEEELYMRSTQVEPRQNTTAGGTSAGSRIIKQFFNVEN